MRARNQVRQPRRLDEFDKDEVEKVVAMAGVKTRHLADESICSSDLCLSAAKKSLKRSSVGRLRRLTR